ncbi:hypothetical protein I307_06632 [Cryptococcus deuterogattii 99/473]|nr:hypothetical protein I307_06632 [Cryptococcus deuterogattii 99/473]
MFAGFTYETQNFYAISILYYK